MATDDYTTIDSKCLCGNGTISVTRTTPDHPWAKASQTSYSGALNCLECRKTYAILNSSGDQMPSLVLRSAVDGHDAAQVAYRAAEKTIRTSNSVERLCGNLVALIDETTSIAARHRLLQKFQLVHITYGTYRRHPTTGPEAIRYTSALSLVRIGIEHGLVDGDDLAFCKRAAIELRGLSDAESSSIPKPVRTGATWLIR